MLKTKMHLKQSPLLTDRGISFTWTRESLFADIRQFSFFLLLTMKTADEWGLLSPDGTLHKLCEPNFFVGRDDQMDLTLKVRLLFFHP